MYLDTVKRFSIKLQHPEGKELTPEGSVNSFKRLSVKRKLLCFGQKIMTALGKKILVVKQYLFTEQSELSAFPEGW